MFLENLGAVGSFKLGADVSVGHDQAEANDDSTPHESKDHREAVEVTLGYTRGTKVGAHAATKHVRQTAATALVQQDQQGQQQAGDTQKDLQGDL